MINDGRSVEFDQMMLVMKQCATIDRSILHHCYRFQGTLLRRSTSRVVLAYLSIHVLKNELAQMGETRKAPAAPPPGKKQATCIGFSWELWAMLEKKWAASPSQSNALYFITFKCNTNEFLYHISSVESSYQHTPYSVELKRQQLLRKSFVV
jgi:hypothetical protein